MAKEKVKKEMAPQNKRRKELGVEVHYWENHDAYFFAADDSRYLRGNSSILVGDDKLAVVGDAHLSRSDRMKLLRRSKAFLARRSFADLPEDYRPKLYGAKNKIETVLDCFPSLKYSYSAPLPPKVVRRNHGMDDILSRRNDYVRYLDVCCAPDGSSKKARMSDLSRSANIRLDPMDAPRQLFVYRCRIRRCLTWGYSVGLVPLMMTLTVFHRWHPLKKLLNVLSKAWNHFFTAGRPATERAERMGLQGYIRRLEETITNGTTDDGYNSGWHPHYHVIIFVPKDKVSVVSSMEEELREAWFNSVNRYFEEEFGEGIEPSYAEAFRKHGLVFSRYGNDDDKYSLDNLTINQSSSTNVMRDLFDDNLTGCDETRQEATLEGIPLTRARGVNLNCAPKQKTVQKRPLRRVDDSDYMSKTFGCDPCLLYSGETEMTMIHAKSSRIPFDLLRDDTAENNDLWVEYAIATKGIRSFVFSRGLEAQVRTYFDVHPNRDSVKSFVKSDKVVAQLDSDVYNLVYKYFKVDEMLKAAAKGYNALCEWFVVFYYSIGCAGAANNEDMMPVPPNTFTPFGGRMDIATVLKKNTTPPPAEPAPRRGQLELQFSMDSSTTPAARAATTIDNNTKSTKCQKSTTPSSTMPSTSTELSSTTVLSVPPAASTSTERTSITPTTDAATTVAPSTDSASISTPTQISALESEFTSPQQTFTQPILPTATSEMSSTDDSSSASVDATTTKPDKRSKREKVEDHLTKSRIQISAVGGQASEEAIKMVKDVLDSEPTEAEAAASRAAALEIIYQAMNDIYEHVDYSSPIPIETQMAEYAEQDLLSNRTKKRYCRILDENDTSFDARLAEVSNSQWYPAWYKAQLQSQARRFAANNEKANSSTSSESADKTRRPK